MTRFIEVSHPVEAGMETYPGLPAPRVDIVMDYEASRPRYQNQAEFFIASLHLCGNTGTYVDSPMHRFRGRADLASLPLESLADLPVARVDAQGERGIGPQTFAGLQVRDCAVLVNTGWSEHWRTPRYFEPAPFLTAEACDALLAAGARFVGIDSLNIDDMLDPSRPAHTKLLGAGVPVCEHMTNLAAVPATGGRLHAVPIAWMGGASFPVRAYVLG
ncbi:MAG TPA: cyclase family protein [Bryobacteraceae bacterium]|nr:cyclase family protein [Bryobacteraceae bacterium]